MLGLQITSVALTFVLLPVCIIGNYETDDTIILEAIKPEEVPENPDSPGPKLFPFLVSITKDGKNICSGALLNKLYVLSSAYCLQNITNEEISKYQIGIGFKSLGGDEKVSDDRGREGPYYVRRVVKVIMDRGFYYQSLKMQNSILLLKLDTEVIFNDHVQPIHLSDNSSIPAHRRKHPLPPIRTATLSGWRKGNEIKGKDMTFLRGVTLRVYSYEECRKEFLNSTKMDEIICANIPTNNPCQFSIGSILTAKRYGKQFLIGLRERDCHFPSVFTRVEHFIPWIRKNLVH